MNERLSNEGYDNYFGGCPECGGNDGCLNVGRNHIFVCDEHRTAWNIGSNLFSGWRDENESIWEENRKKLAGYREVRPIDVTDGNAKPLVDRTQYTDHDAWFAALQQKQRWIDAVDHVRAWWRNSQLVVACAKMRNRIRPPKYEACDNSDIPF